MRTLGAIALIAVVAGCLADAPKGDVAAIPLPSDSAIVVFNDRLAPNGAVIEWQGKRLEADHTRRLPMLARSAACGPPDCETVSFDVNRGADSDPALVLRVTASWPYVTCEGDFDPRHPWFSLRLSKPGGAVAPSAESTYGDLVRLVDPPAGRYELAVRVSDGLAGAHAYRGAIRLDREPEPPTITVEQPPDLALIFVGDLKLTKAVPGDQISNSPPAPWTKGCGIDEFQESRPLKCLRFAASIANAGPGPLMLFFPSGDGTVTVQQCVRRSDGSTFLRPAGQGSWHSAHNHHHQADVASYQLYAYDLDAKVRGARVGTGQKFGWGFAAQGVMPHLMPDTYSNNRVFYPPRDECKALTGSHAGYGLPKGWHDPYLSWRNGNFVDVTSVPDGVYELEVVLNEKNDTLEAGVFDNVGSVLLRLRGDTVEQLSTFERDFAPART